jgi:hypothetical protein
MIMKKLILFLTISLTMFCNVANTQETNEVYTGQPTYVTPNKDTMYIKSDMYNLFLYVWNRPEYKSEKPVLVVVNSVRVFYRREDG